MKRAKWAPIFGMTLVAMMGAALGLGYYGYHAASKLTERSEASVERSTRALGLKLSERIETVIIDGDRTFFNLVSLDDPREFRELWRRIVKVSPAVESVIVLDATHKVIHLVAKLEPTALDTFRRVFVHHILPKMDLAHLALNRHKHLYTRYQGKAYLISFIRRQSGGSDYFIALSVNLPYLVGDVFRQEFQSVEDTQSIAVIDENGTVLYGRPIPAESSLVFDEHFPTTLYKWRLLVAPRQLQSLSAGARTRRTTDIALFGGSVAIIWIGLLLLYLAVRKAQRANALKSEFIANVSHELKTPVSLIRMFGEMLASRRVEDPQTISEYAEIITRESDRLSRQIDTVLDFARVDHGKANYEMHAADLRPLLERVVDLSRYRFDQADLRLDLVLPEQPLIVLHDESAMTLLVLNLLDNALKYGAVPNGRVTVTLRQDETNAQLTVSDEGSGIPPEEQPSIFERFFRGRAARAGAQRGSGIGLSLVAHVVDAHRGTIQVHSMLGRGTTFEVTIPLHGAS